ncbi:hypothetical protein [Pseudomonas sp. NFX224]|uniref:hypothetical protein n=1 Tax=Pseudomonas sp. NFX224 TaxID=3402862 RepID=UPI003AFB60DD
MEKRLRARLPQLAVLATEEVGRQQVYEQGIDGELAVLALSTWGMPSGVSSTLAIIGPPETTRTRYRPTDALLKFLESL